MLENFVRVQNSLRLIWGKFKNTKSDFLSRRQENASHKVPYMEIV